MPLYLTAAHSSRVSKPAQRSTSNNSSTRRHSASPFANIPRTKASASRAKSLSETLDDGDDDEQWLETTGKVLPTLSVDGAKDVLSAMQHARATMFAALPDRAGMNSVRIAEVLNFQKNLPAIVSLAHVHAVVSASSKTERQLATLQAAGKVRKLRIAGRGNDISGTSEVLITMNDLQLLLEQSRVAAEVTSDFCNLLLRQPRATSIPAQALPASHVTALTRTGFLVSASLSGSRNLSLAGSSLVGMEKISRAASGTPNAVGGEAAFENLGGTGGAKRPTSGAQSTLGGDLTLSVPNLGPYLRLLNAGRAHLLELLGKSKYKEGPLYLLREKWDGAVDSDNRVSSAKRLRGEFSSVLPAKTKKWKDLYGLNFDWVVEECLGAGLIELFETKSVGLGIRSLG
ncbi:hypothetical protein PV08_05037 [Exophiala spinifera]|uniref:Serine-threonine protein kinase 19 n=1 Tax=Exophiala spinifera TaxID=91928 RepID=A0A0D1ZYU9_9EURO|nr:uncharacterized protein PV08_05037 [Exophiala spinifera]KIW17842.1 hypothetical protein PV08_05037 [Exophiala spinifera]